MGSSATSLASLKIAVGGGSTALSGLELVVVHGQTHAASGLAPVKAGLDQNLVETLFLGLFLDQTGSGNNIGVNSLGDLAAGGNGGSLAHVLDAAVRARSNKGLADLDTLDLQVAFQTNIIEGALHGSLAGIIGGLFGIWNISGDGNDVLWRGSPGDGGSNVLRLDVDNLVVDGILVTAERLPVVDGLVPVVLGGRHGASFEVFKGDLVGGNEPRAGTGLDGHVRDTHAGLHTERTNGGSSEFNDTSGTTGSSNDTANVQNNILGGHGLVQRSLDFNQEILPLHLGKRRSGKDVLDLAGSNSKGQSPKCTVGCRVAVSAHTGSSRQGESLFGSNNMDNSLSLVFHSKVLEAKVLDVLFELKNLGSRVDFGNEGFNVLELFSILRGDVVIDRQQGAIGSTNTAVGQSEALKGLGRCHLVDQVSVDVQESRAIGFGDGVVLKDLVVKGFAGI
mmetsp:Transcript_7321/g.15145  ORF Transcript_7321/g.15145 Transcript_7321/m.15145 type:complete len:450 (+) Transcript_7321:1617-2966(+)